MAGSNETDQGAVRHNPGRLSIGGSSSSDEPVPVDISALTHRFDSNGGAGGKGAGMGTSAGLVPVHAGYVPSADDDAARRRQCDRRPVFHNFDRAVELEVDVLSDHFDSQLGDALRHFNCSAFNAVQCQRGTTT